MDIKQEAIQKHAEWKGKIEVITRAPVASKHDLSVAYTPGVAEPCLEISENVDLSYKYTRRHNLVAVVTDGTAVLGLGDIGPEAGMPVMEGKCALFKAFGDVDAFPLCIRSKDVDEIVNTVALLAGSFGGVNLEDISAPRCFEIEKKLKERCDIPIFHDDQHGTAVITLAGLTNALKIVGKKIEEISVVVNGAGAAATAITKLLISRGLKDVVLCDRTGAIYQGREKLNSAKEEIAAITNQKMKKGSLKDVIVGADVFIGVSAPGVLTAEMVATMAKDPIVFACANPTPEILPDEAKKAGVAVMATGRSDFPNQVNNVLAFPGIFRGALDVRASDINDEMKIAAANAIAGVVSDEELNPEYILPDAFDPRVGKAVAEAVAEAARKSGVARI
ncbi:MAG: NAD-dependent malic enzyme [Clostridiales bacterium]|nr:NAD-dependent malic enzyme [Clostridiales bacterium]MBQ5967504.1 NAD-dependent malic enzyme [Clostridiales bacterium]MBQ6270401.1 NAD-dependent malic enzyme [Clostridiales bacterium]MCR5057123.1 NAD-dependent malic enzyme [Clostridiales bacterium]